MGARFEELAYAATPMGEVSLRRRTDPVTGVEVHEVKLGEEYLMSSLFTAAEVAMAQLALGRLDEDGWSVVVGGLGLGYTAHAVLADDRVTEVLVVDALEAVIDWHRRGLVPLGAALTADPRVRIEHSDFFALCAGPGLDPDEPGRVVDAVLVDIDHSPRHLLTGEATSPFYGVQGTRSLARHLRPGGVYALWSNDPPDEEYLTTLRSVFAGVAAEVVRFPNPLQGGTATNTVYLATAP